MNLKKLDILAFYRDIGKYKQISTEKQDEGKQYVVNSGQPENVE